MVCPRCKNKGFKPSEDLKQPLVNLGGKQHFDNFNKRRYNCTECGFTFYTVEKYDHPIGNHELDPKQVEAFDASG